MLSLTRVLIFSEMGIVMKKLLLLILVLMISGCSDYKAVIHSGEGIEGTWNTEFTATYFDNSGIPEDDGDTYNLTHTSTMILKDGQFDITLDPAVPPFWGFNPPRSHWEGDYFFEDDYLVMIERNVIDMEDIYRFRLSGDTLNLILNYNNHPDNDSIMVIPFYGGLPWGRAQLWHGGYFLRDMEND
jgi:hypothetical protein